MRKLVWLIVLIPALWSGYWFVAARGIERGIGAWLDARAAEGWVAETASIQASGFPLRFQTVLADVELADPDTGLAWSLPRLEILIESYRPNRVEIIGPKQFTVASPFERITVVAGQIDALAEVDPGPQLGVRTLSADLGAVDLASTAGWMSGFESGRVLTQRDTEDPNTHAIEFRANALRLSKPLRDFLDPANALPPEIEGFELLGRFGFDRPWDRRALETRRPQPTRIEIERLEARWGPALLAVAGTLDIDGAGRATGQITLRAENWREMLEVARVTGAVPEPFHPTVEQALEALARVSGRPDMIDAPLSFRNGVVFFGLLPLGQAPRFVIR